MKKFLLFVILAFTCQVLHAFDFYVDGFYFKILSIAEKTCQIERSIKTGAVIIPSTVTYDGKTYTVKGICDSAFMNCNDLTSVTSPNSVISLGNYAFYNCSNLASVTISDNITNIGDCAFGKCSVLSSATIPICAKSIGNGAFLECSALTSITIPYGVISIEKSAFYGCSSLTSITIPNSVTKIGELAFSGCKELSSIVFQNASNCDLGDNVFYNTKWLTNAGDYVYLGNCLYRYKGNGKTATIKNNTKKILSYAFYNCSALTSVTIPNSVTGIGKNAFFGCSGISSVTIPNSVTSIGDNAFAGCNRLQNLEYNAKNAIVSMNPKGLSFPTSIKTITIGNQVESIPDYFIYGNANVSSIILPNCVTRIGDYAFYNCKLKTLIIGTDVKSIGSKALGVAKPTKVIWLPNTPPSGCKIVAGSINYVSNENYTDMSNTRVYKYLSSMFDVDGIKYVPVSPSERTCVAIDCNYDKTIENIKIADVISYKNIGMTVLNINPYTCYGNEFIKTLTINNGGRIDEHAFDGCGNITSVSFGNKITEIGDYAFGGCSGIKNIEITNYITSVGTYAFSDCSALQSIKIGNGTTSIGDYCFKDCSHLQTMVAGNRLMSIGDYCFSGCSSMQKVLLGDCPVTIGAYAFKNCTSLTELNLGKKMKAIDNYAFAYCSSLTKISIPKTTTSIGNYAFYACRSLTDVTFEDRTESISLGSNDSSPLFASCPINTVYLGGKLSYNTSSDFGYSPFYRNKNLQSVIIADTEEQIYDNEFYGCTNLKSVTIGDGVKSIGNWAFSGCASLESFSFGKSMQSIGQEAFSDCTKMTSITSYAATAPECGSQALDDIDKWSCVLSVPYSSLASYQNAAQWKEFFFIQEAEIDEKLVADKAVFDKYKSDQKAIIEALAKEGDSDAVKDIINKAISDINAMEYDVKMSLDENKAKILSFVNSIDEAVEKQRVEDKKTSGI